MKLSCGSFCEFGARVKNDRITFTYKTESNKESYINIYNITTYELIDRIEMTSEYRLGRVCSVEVEGLNASKICYLIYRDG
ncbi:MAG: hypothetical protein K5644_08955, partial [Lachnospiraceae bacterium]|nr:hypothetical protein [Lachnospiraceae bacterium]